MNLYSSHHIWFLYLFVIFAVVFPPIAESNQVNQSKKYSLLSLLALSSQNKFFLKTPPTSRKETKACQAAGSSDAYVAAELDDEADSSEPLSPTCQYENYRAGLDFAISDLVSLDSQAEVDQGIFIRKGATEISVRLRLSSMCCSVLCHSQKTQRCSSKKPLCLPFTSFF